MELMTIQEAADALRVKPITVRRYIAKGRLKAVRVGRGLRVEKEAVEALPEPTANTSPVDDLAPSARKYAKYLKGPVPEDSPFWGIIGIGEGDPNENVSGNKYRYLADIYAAPGATWGATVLEE